MNIKIFKTEIEGKELSVELGRLAQQTNGSALVTYGQTSVLATAVLSNKKSEKNYFPLTVDYEERFYAAGKIKGSRFIKREGRPSDEAILTGRLIDRSIRPLFNQKIKNDLQIVLTVVSFDGENDPGLPALLGASVALSVSNIPFNGPVAGISAGQDDKGNWMITSTLSAKAKTGSEIFAAGIEKNKDILLNMIEGQAPQMLENQMLEGIDLVRKHIKKLIDFQKDIIKEIKPIKLELEIKEIDAGLKNLVDECLADKLETAIYHKEKQVRVKQLNDINLKLEELVKEKHPEEAKEKLTLVMDYLEEKIDEITHINILKNNKRPDGRKLDELRSLSAEVGLLPRLHGSGLFQRGETQVFSAVTLGSPGSEQIFDQMEIEGKKGFMHDYNFPPFSVGEVGRVGSPGRRELGHGALAEKALAPIIPPKEDFPYTIRVVSEVLSSNGSSSMASVCGSTLALMDAGVPIKEKVAGIAMGLMLEQAQNPNVKNQNYRILTDIQGPEDHYGDMDLKIAGTKNGVNAIQMDIKVDGISMDILKETFKQAKKARLEILEVISKTIKEPRPELSPFAPRVYSIKINPAKIGLVIGSGGKTINEISAETGAIIEIEDDGTVFVTSENADGAKEAIGRIKAMTREAKIGEEFEGRVVKIMDFGAFVELFSGQDGLLHISELSNKRVEKVEDVIRQGDMVRVKVKRIEDNGKISLSLIEILSKK
ncbi:MAG TPA: polyribonucleotide nucleotidyltransferase [Candidatus Portnoybacteria bacterium]|jgi:polyribonucleotide nucleotidyltransferase|nr:polyribonucleotide nucleotidyltransferase [Candidatus Portnoybacteria bacterium]MDD5752334.1 polyribonucleotide nucleotidyltransferase [Candidatus Portnoybacteria bacterium]HOZ16669.1 polyribonucleotide nucleotidyltransferase [Candidatus Portnoybacteria bacterium]HPH52393.1 polyribonucleotide nucleotidyltransferase [Candidatus Portnoybacteria bacterium]HPJ80560.1 polyribonucleotide nucleotidyltransferase [Candidatus Portnoybacteria bacterium]